MKHGRSIAFLVTFILLAGVLLPAYANQLEDKQRELSSINQKIQKQRDQINQARKQEKSIMKEIQVIENGMESTRAQIKSLESRVKAVERDIAVTEDQIREAEALLKERTDYLQERLVTIYEDGDLSYLEVLFDSTDIGDFLTRYDLLKEILQQDLQLITEIEREQARLTKIKQGLEGKKNDLLYIRTERKAHENLLEEQATMKEEVLGSVKVERQRYEQALRELEETSRQLEKIIRSLQKPGGAYQGTGAFTWPAPGYSRITSEYGMRYHPILKVRKLHTGMDIGASRGARIVAADGGTVLSTGSMGGYGNTVIIDHGDGITTLYAHLSKISVSSGEAVRKGDTIGAAGSTGWSTGPHLHFEVRKNGTPVNPRQWI